MIDTKSQIQEYDYLIIGQGLAGSVLAMTLMKNGFKVLVVNDETLSTASSVAAGLFNPVYGKELNITWLANEIFPVLHDFYSEVNEIINFELKSDSVFFHQSKIFRSFINPKQQNKFFSELTYFQNSGFVNESIDFEKYKLLIKSDLNGFLVENSGWLDTKLFVEMVRAYLKTKNVYISEKYNESSYYELKRTSSIKKIIFCEGFYGAENPKFSWLPWNPAKGEILTIKILTDLSWGQEIINAGIFIVPLGNQLYRVGATYAWHEFSFEPTQKAREDLIAKLDKLLMVPYEIVGHTAGVRPATKHRRPFIGLHPEEAGIGIFNGLGSKGVSLAPYFAQQFVDFLENNQQIHPEANIEQYYPLYFK